MSTNGVIEHCIPKHYVPSNDETSFPLYQTKFCRSSSCSVLINTKSTCSSCIALEKKENRSFKQTKENLFVPAKLNATITFTSPEKLKATIQTIRVENNELKNQIEEMQVEISQKTVPVDNEFNNDILSIMYQADKIKNNTFHEVFLGRATKIFIY